MCGGLIIKMRRFDFQTGKYVENYQEVPASSTPPSIFDVEKLRLKDPNEKLSLSILRYVSNQEKASRLTEEYNRRYEELIRARGQEPIRSKRAAV
jgi:hypothetical protein